MKALLEGGGGGGCVSQLTGPVLFGPVRRAGRGQGDGRVERERGEREIERKEGGGREAGRLGGLKAVPVSFPVWLVTSTMAQGHWQGV